MRVFVAGGGGAIGRRLVPKLVERGHEVVASTRDANKFEGLRALGARPLAMDGLDAASVGETVARAEPDVVVIR
jgi:nucleoside-diphosphate-sugar epimerase